MSSLAPDMGVIGVQLSSGSWSTGVESTAVAEVSPRGRRSELQGFKPTLNLGVNSALKTVTVPAGDYTVRLYLPSGDVLAESVSVGAGGQEVVNFELHDSPHEWLSQEAAYGAVQRLPQLARAEALESVANRIDDTDVDFVIDAASLLRSPAGRRPPGLLGRQRAHLAGLAAADMRSSHEVIERISGQQRVPAMQAHRWLSQVDPARPFPDTRLDEKALVLWWTGTPEPVPLPLVREVYDERNAKFIAPSAPFGPPIGSGPQRAFAAIQDPTGKGFYAVLPEGWRKTSSSSFGAPATARLLMTVVVDSVLRGSGDTGAPARWRCSTSVDDVEGMSLLGFLNAGQAAAADALMGQAEEALFEKTENPVLAAVGAFVLLAHSDDANTRTRPRWRDWIRNLSSRFPHLPDGAIAEAQMYLRHGDARSPDEELDVERLRQLVLQAVRRGLPYLTLSISTLTELLMLVVRDDECAHRSGEAVTLTQRAHRLVLQLGRAVEPGEFFTVLRLDDREVAQ
jgi:hypothetical protein